MKKETSNNQNESTGAIFNSALITEDERDKLLLWWYFQVLMNYGSKAHRMPKKHLYEIAGEKVGISVEAASTIIKHRLKDSSFVDAVIMMPEFLPQDAELMF